MPLKGSTGIESGNAGPDVVVGWGVTIPDFKVLLY